ncbi:MAG: RsbRD N-terminal domain-containing protein [Bryobacterales bacterium]|nr:RsbRD N-terminal domain-containing protein [Bryobacterales bacterium]
MRALAGERSAVVREWFERTLQSYPEQTSGFLRGEKDPFRNPVGHTLRDGLGVLFDELAGEMDQARITAALDAIVRIRAVQDHTASQAVAFLFLLKEVLRDKSPAADLAMLEKRIDRMALLAFDLYMKCREKIYEIKAEEAKRRVYVLERAGLKRGDAR